MSRVEDVLQQKSPFMQWRPMVCIPMSNSQQNRIDVEARFCTFLPADQDNRTSAKPESGFVVKQLLYSTKEALSHDDSGRHLQYNFLDPYVGRVLHERVVDLRRIIVLKWAPEDLRVYLKSWQLELDRMLRLKVLSYLCLQAMMAPQDWSTVAEAIQSLDSFPGHLYCNLLLLRSHLGRSLVRWLRAGLAIDNQSQVPRVDFVLGESVPVSTGLATVAMLLMEGLMPESLHLIKLKYGLLCEGAPDAKPSPSSTPLPRASSARSKAAWRLAKQHGSHCSDLKSFLSCCLDKRPRRRLTLATALQHDFLKEGREFLRCAERVGDISVLDLPTSDGALVHAMAVADLVEGVQDGSMGDPPAGIGAAYHGGGFCSEGRQSSSLESELHADSSTGTWSGGVNIDGRSSPAGGLEHGNLSDQTSSDVADAAAMEADIGKHGGEAIPGANAGAGSPPAGSCDDVVTQAAPPPRLSPCRSSLGMVAAQVVAQVTRQQQLQRRRSFVGLGTQQRRLRRGMSGIQAGLDVATCVEDLWGGAGATVYW